MPEVGLFEAKTHLSKLVEDIESGREKEIILTRRGKPVARLSGLSTIGSKQQTRSAFRIFDKVREEMEGPVTIEELRLWIEEGRR